MLVIKVHCKQCTWIGNYYYPVCTSKKQMAFVRAGFFLSNHRCSNSSDWMESNRPLKKANSACYNVVVLCFFKVIPYNTSLFTWSK